MVLCFKIQIPLIYCWYIVNKLIFVYEPCILQPYYLCLLVPEYLCHNFRFSAYMMVSSVNKDNFVSYFPIHMPLITYFCLTVLAMTDRTILTRNGEMGHSCLVLTMNKV